MTTFIFALDADATPMREALLRSVLESRFPAVTFRYDASPAVALENAIIPIWGYPHPTEPDAIVMRPPPADLVADIREAFNDAVRGARSWRPS